MATICPAVLAKDTHDYREQMERVTTFAERVQIDLTDGQFANAKTVSLEHIWWPDDVKADLHLMYKQPTDFLTEAIRLKPHLVIVHAEANGDFEKISHQLRAAHIKAG